MIHTSNDKEGGVDDPCDDWSHHPIPNLRRRTTMASKQAELKESDTIETACNFYMRTPKYQSLSYRSKKDYDYNLLRACKTKVQNDKVLGNIKLL
jgi:hypothetical protein